jgi:hypothetical protein
MQVGLENREIHIISRGLYSGVIIELNQNIIKKYMKQHPNPVPALKLRSEISPLAKRVKNFEYWI